MRILASSHNSSTGTVTTSTQNKFEEFAFTDASDRHLKRDDMRQFKQTSQKMNKRIITSDDEDEEGVHSTSTHTKSSSGWLSARDPSNLSSNQRQLNVSVAMNERKKISVGTGSKAKTTVSYNSDDDESLLESNTPVGDKKRKLVKKLSTSRIEEAIKAPQVRLPKKQKTMQDEKGDDDDDDEEEADSDDDDDDDDSAGGWGEEKTKSDIQEEAMRILRSCEKISANLRSSLKEWGSSSVTDTSDVTTSKSPSGGEEGCLNIISIRNPVKAGSIAGGTGQEVLSDEDVQQLCPGLQLKPYQLVGVNWLKLLHVNNINGVLADDMGLGKTVQTIAFLGWLRSHRSSSSSTRRPHLIVVPASTLSNWENELSKFCSAFEVRTYHGSQKERAELRYLIKGEVEDGEVDVVLSTYTVFERESGKDDRRFLSSLNFEYLVLDEAHCIKNTESSRYTHLNNLKTRHRLLLSGTPVQNDVGELLALLSFLMPKTFSKSDCELLLEAFGWHKGATGQVKGAGFSISQLRSMLSPFVLRRLKRDVLDQLVDKTTRVVRVEMTATQKLVYAGVLEGYQQNKLRMQQRVAAEDAELALIEVGMRGKPKGPSKAKTTIKAAAAATASSAEVIDLVSPGPSVVAESKGDEANVIDVSYEPSTATVATDGEIISGSSGSASALDLSASEAKHLFTALRKAANHPLLLRVRYKDPVKMDRIAQVAFAEEHFGNQCDVKRVKDELDLFSDFELHRICMDYSHYLGELELPAEALYDSPKMCALREMIPDLAAKGHRMLVFSQWTRLMDLLEVFLQDMGMKYLRLDGSTPVKDRQELIDEYNAAAQAQDSGDSSTEAIPVFLLSTKAGGLGINLTSADTVILHDLDFNPENDRQAEDRCHRIGQTKPVTVYKLVAVDTVDEDIFEMGERKRLLSEAVLSDDRARVDGCSNSGSSPRSPRAGGGKAGATSAAEDDGDCDIGAIGRILQKALQRAAKPSQNL